MFNDRYGLTEAVLSGRKTQTRRILPAGTPLGSWRETPTISRPGKSVRLIIPSLQSKTLFHA